MNKIISIPFLCSVIFVESAVVITDTGINSDLINNVFPSGGVLACGLAYNQRGAI